MRRYAPLLAPLILSACATVTSSDMQELRVSTEPAGVPCMLGNKEGKWNIDSTPATISVKRSFSPLTIYCASNHSRASATLEPRTRGRTYGNLLMLGVPAVVDASTGAGYEYTPEHVELTLTPE